jgi:hypothetical protein
VPERGYQNEMLDEWVGEVVLMGLLYAPELEDEEAQSMGEDPSLLKSHITQSARALYRFVAYNEIGITIRQLLDEEQAPPIFVPWGAVLRLEWIGEPKDEEPDQG